MLTQSIYQVFIRNHTEEGSIKALIKDIDRIQSMGFDILYLMPFHPISVLNRKGTYGSPYAIANYYEVSEDLGTLDDLQELINKAHLLNMKVIMDIVFNHTGRDHTYITTHPEYYVLDNEKKPFVYVSEGKGVVEIHIANLPVEVQMDLMKKVFELEESFIQHRLDSVE